MTQRAISAWPCSKQEEIERLKPIPTVVGPYCEYRMKLEPKGQNMGNGGPSDKTDDRPYLRTSHTLTYGAHHLFIFGGTLNFEQRKAGASTHSHFRST
jgi:hypothetical protein